MNGYGILRSKYGSLNKFMMINNKIIKAYSNLYEAINHDVATVCPAGWYTTADLQQHWEYATLRAASCKALDYYIKGLFIREQYKLKTRSKACKAYAYYPSAKYKSLAQCDYEYRNYNVDKIPAGWVSVRDLKIKYKISKSFVHDLIDKWNLDYKIYKAANKLGGYTAMMFINYNKFKKLYDQRS